MYAEASTFYRSCLTDLHENDPDIRYSLANALVPVRALEGAGRLGDALESARPWRTPTPAKKRAGAMARC